MTDTKTLDIDGILERLPHRYPFLMVDRVLDVVPGKSIVADQEHQRQRGVLPGALSRAIPSCPAC